MKDERENEVLRSTGKMNKKIACSLLLSIFISLIACTSPLSPQEQSFQADLTHYSKNQSVIELAKLATFDWDLVCVSYTYESSVGMLKRLNMAPEAIPQSSVWEGSEVIFRFVFFKNGIFVDSLRINASESYLRTSGAKHSFCFNQAEAVVSLEASKNMPIVIVEFQSISN